MTAYNSMLVSLILLAMAQWVTLNNFSDRIHLGRIKALNMALVLVAAVLTASFIGFRYDVGGDWSAYVRLYEYSRDLSISELLNESEPFYLAFSLLADALSMNFIGHNLLLALFCIFALTLFSRNFKYSILFIVAAFPLIHLMAFAGFVRQGLAFSCLLIAVYFLQQRGFLIAIFFSGLAFLAHNSALIMATFLVLCPIPDARKKLKYLLIISLASISYIAINYDFSGALVYVNFQRMFAEYLNANLVSKGAFFKGSLIFFSAAYLLLKSKRIQDDTLRTFLISGCVISILTSSLIFIIYPLALFDRLLIYSYHIVPVVVLMTSHLLSRGGKNILMVIVPSFFSIVTLNFWLLFANHSSLWMPYRFSVNIFTP